MKYTYVFRKLLKRMKCQNYLNVFAFCFSGMDDVAILWGENHHEVMSVDIDPRFDPEIFDDIYN
jgi:hypothetical protein